MARDIVVVRHGDASVVTVSREKKRNALTRETMRELQRAVGEEEHNGASALVLTGGTEIFSAGIDLSELGGGVQDAEVDAEIMRTAELIRGLRIPVIAAIEGPCFGAAVEIAMACDLRVAAKGAYFSIPATRLGLLYRPQAIADLTSLLGRSVVTRLFIFSERIHAEEAVVVGLATHLAESGTAQSAALALVGELSTLTVDAVTATKRLINELWSSRKDFSDWEEVRRSLLASDARSRALSNARAHLGHESTEASINEENRNK